MLKMLRWWLGSPQWCDSVLVDLNQLAAVAGPLRKDKDDWVRRNMEMVIEGKRGVGRPRMTWVKAVESDMRVKGLMREDAEDRTKWRAMSWGAKG